MINYSLKLFCLMLLLAFFGESKHLEPDFNTILRLLKLLSYVVSGEQNGYQAP